MAVIRQQALRMVKQTRTRAMLVMQRWTWLSKGFSLCTTAWLPRILRCQSLPQGDHLKKGWLKLCVTHAVNARTGVEFHCELCWKLLWPFGCWQSLHKIACCGPYSMKLEATREKNGLFKDPLGPKTYCLKSEKPMFPMFYLTVTVIRSITVIWDLCRTSSVPGRMATFAGNWQTTHHKVQSCFPGDGPPHHELPWWSPGWKKRLKRLCIKWYGVNIVRFGLFSDQLSLPFTLPHSGQSAPPAIKTASVRAFMIHMYFTASEPMPTSWLNFKSGTSS